MILHLLYLIQLLFLIVAVCLKLFYSTSSPLSCFLFLILTFSRCFWLVMKEGVRRLEELAN